MTDEALFHEALDRPAEERAAFLERACAGDDDLRRRVEALLAAHASPGSFLAQPALDLVATGDMPLGNGPAEAAGSRIGPYKLLQQLGEGGMGTVWLAEQSEPVRRRVALKLIRAGLDSAHVLARFEQERQALAVMDHPHIAKVFDAGATAAGRPYFVMELVKGIPITKYCDQEHLSPRERLDLFIPVCQAVQHAHQKGIIHRDIKPSNVLIALYDGKPVPKVIDFGVSKATNQKLTERSMFTEVGQIVGTLEYMAPEQAELNNLDIDTRADIYSLGVLLYELLTGSPPFTSKQLRGAAFMEMMRMIREVEPPKPSTRLSGSADLPSIAANRKLEPGRLTRLVHGDLDWIVMKCLEKERNRRYETANALAQEVQRYLADEPVQAGPPRVTYRLRKFVRRNKRPVLAAGLVLLTLLAGLGGTTAGLFEARRQRQDANDQRGRALKAEGEAKEEAKRATAAAEDAKAVVNFFQTNVLAATRPKGQEGGLGREATVRQAVDAAEPGIAAGFGDRPYVEAAIRVTLGTTYSYLSEPALAARQYERARELYEAGLGSEAPQTLSTMNSLAQVYKDGGQNDRAILLLEHVLRAQRATLGPGHEDTCSSMNSLGEAYTQVGKPDRAIPLLEDALKAQKTSLGPAHRHTLATMNNLALAYQNVRQMDRAFALFEESLDGLKNTLGAIHPNTLASIQNLALAYVQSGKLDRAIALFEKVLPLMKAQLGSDHAWTLMCMNNLAGTYMYAGKGDRAVPLFEETLRASETKNGRDHPETLNTMNNLATAYLGNRDWDKAERILRETLKRRETRPSDDWRTPLTRSQLGGALLGQRKFAESEPLLLGGYEGMKQREKTIPPLAKKRLTAAAEWLVELYNATGRPDKAAAWRKTLEEARAAETKPKP